MSTNYQTEKLVPYDIEVFRNFFLVGFYAPPEFGGGFISVACDSRKGNRYSLELIESILKNLNGHNGELVGFNSNRYDDVVLSEFLNTGSVEAAYRLSCGLISGDVKPWDCDRSVYSVDLMPLLPGRHSLKSIGVRLNHPRLQELPIEPHAALTQEKMAEVVEYNKNDLAITWKLLNAVRPQLELRADMSRRYAIDLRSSGDATIAEQVLGEQLSQMTGWGRRELKNRANENGRMGYVAVPEPPWWKQLGGTGQLAGHVESVQRWRFERAIPLDENGRLVASALTSSVYLDDRWYRTGVGGLHSVDGAGCYHTGEDGMDWIIDADVASYYPAIALNCEFFPRHVYTQYGKIYQELVDQRLAAKKSGDKVTADTLKITINGAFGKTSDPYSALYDPWCTAGITVTGQMALLMLIAMLADQGIRTLSANTDGVTVAGQADQRQRFYEVVARWGEATGFDMEFTPYTALYQKDVNNYLAVKEGGKYKGKGKGVFAISNIGGVDLYHSPMFNIAAIAVRDYLVHGRSIEETVWGCNELKEFLITQKTTGAWRTYWGGQELGKMVRFYRSVRKDAAPIIKKPGAGDKGNEGVVAHSEASKPVQDLPEGDGWRNDLDYQWYIGKAVELLELVTRKKRRGWNDAAFGMSQRGFHPVLVNSDGLTGGRAFPELGTVDFNSAMEGEQIGIATGKKAKCLVALGLEGEGVLSTYRWDNTISPGKVRAKMVRDTGIQIYYGPSVKVPYWTELQWVSADVFNRIRGLYTPTEQKRAGWEVSDE